MKLSISGRTRLQHSDKPPVSARRSKRRSYPSSGDQRPIDLPPSEHFARIPGHDTIGDRVWLRMQGHLKVHYTATVEITG